MQSECQPQYRYCGYDSSSHITSITDKRGKVWAFTYSGDGISTETDPLSHVTSYATGTSGGYTTTTITDPNSHTTADKYDATTGDLVESDDALANAATFAYDSDHNRTSVTNARGKTSTFTYDSMGNVLTVTDPLSDVTTLTYNSDNDVLTTTTQLGHVTTNTYDSNGNLDTVSDPLSHVSTFTRNSYGEVTSITDPLYHTKTIAYDSYGNPTSITDALGHVTSSTYDTLGRVTSSTNGVSLTSSTTYDAWGRVHTVTAPSTSGARTTTFAYDAESHKTSVTNALSQTDSFVYDDAGRLTSHTDALSRTVSYGYDNAGNKTSFTDGNSHTTYYSYTNRDQLSSISYPDSTGQSYAYYATGQLYQKTDGKGVTAQYTLDDTGLVTGIAYSDSTPSVSFSYDADNRKASMTDTTGTTSYGYDNASRLTSRTTPQGTVSFAYDDANRQTSRTITAGTTTLTYDNADRLTSAAAPGALGTETTSYSYDNANRQVTMTLPTGQVETKAYSSTTGDLSSIVRTASSSTVDSYSYGYDNLGRKTSETLGGGDSTGYTYDAAGQLTAEVRTGTVAYSIGYTYDYAGNRLTKTTGAGTEYYTYDDANKLLTAGTKSYSYDYAGNTTGVYNSATSTTTTLTWDGEERLKTAGNGTFSDAYAYNGLDQQSGKADSTGTFSFLREDDGIDSPVLADGAATYNYGAGLTSEVRGGTSKFYQSDALGSTRELTNSSGTITDAHETDAFGNTVAASGSTPTPFGFAGQAGYQTDSDTGLKLLGYRYYDSSTGRFISRDPIQDGDNWYVYCDNDPMNGVDSKGLKGEEVLPIIRRAIAKDLLPRGTDREYRKNKDFKRAIHEEIGDRKIPGPKVKNPDLSEEQVIDIVEDFLPKHLKPTQGATPDRSDPPRGKGRSDPSSTIVPQPHDPHKTGLALGIGAVIVEVFCVLTGVGCFSPETPVVLADGTTKAIRLVVPGDYVMARSEKTGIVQARKVLRVSHTSITSPMTLITFPSGERIESTPGHPIYVNGKGFIPAASISTSFACCTATNSFVSATSVRATESGLRTVYNLEVESDHTFFVGNTKIWVRGIQSQRIDQESRVGQTVGEIKLR